VSNRGGASHRAQGARCEAPPTTCGLKVHQWVVAQEHTRIVNNHKGLLFEGALCAWNVLLCGRVGDKRRTVEGTNAKGVIEYIGGKCERCGASADLEMHHVSGDGAEHSVRVV
jgi:hypothetical protein